MKECVCCVEGYGDAMTPLSQLPQPPYDTAKEDMIAVLRGSILCREEKARLLRYLDEASHTADTNPHKTALLRFSLGEEDERVAGTVLG